jgi:uncharacterized protein involved in outer membrane biogenesis
MRPVLLWSLGGLLALVIGAAGLVDRLLSGDAIREALEAQASSWIGHPVRIGAARADLFPRPAIRLTDVRVGDPAQLTLADIQLSAALGALIGRRIEDGTIVVSGSRIDMPLEFLTRAGGTARAKPDAVQSPSAGDAQAEPGTSRPESGGFQAASIRSIVLRDVRIASRGRSVAVSAEASLRGRRLALTRFEGRSDRSTLEAEGEFDLEPRVDGRLRVKAGRLDLDELLALAASFLPPASATRARPGPPVRMAARVSAESATAGGLAVQQLAMDLEIDGDRLSLAPLTFRVFGGRYEGSLRATIGAAMTARLVSRVADLDMRQLVAFGGAPESMTGRLTGAGTFSGRGADMAAVLASARGQGTASVVDGTIRRLGLVRTVVLFFGRPAPDAAPGSDTFERLDAKFSVEGGVVRAEALSLHSADADVVGAGTLELASQTLDVRLDLSLSEALSAQAGTDFARYTREGNRIVLPALVRGRLGEPRLTIDAKAAVKRGLRNEVERRLEGLLERFGR